MTINIFTELATSFSVTQHKWATSWQNQQNDCVPNEDSDQPGHSPVRSESSLCPQWVAKDPSFLHADSKDSEQTGRMPRLIWVFAGCTCQAHFNVRSRKVLPETSFVFFFFNKHQNLWNEFDYYNKYKLYLSKIYIGRKHLNYENSHCFRGLFGVFF